MLSKPLAFALLAVSCLTAAAGGAYLATRQNAAEVSTTTAPAAAAAPDTAPVATPATPPPVAETEATVSPSGAPPAHVEKEEVPASPVRRPAPALEPSAGTRAARATPPRTVPRPERPVQPPSTPAPQTQASDPPPAAPAPTLAQNTAEQKIELPRPVEPQPDRPRERQFEELVLPASSVIGLQVETALSSERARVEDRVDARVTRDVLVNGQVAIPAGSRVLGSVTMVDRGGKVKSAARLGIRFHTLVLADGSEVTLHTEPFYRDGESPAGDSTKKIGGAAVGGAILGAILGGGKGAVIGGATGAAGGTAAVMAGDRQAAVVAPGSIVTVHLSSPATIQVERRQE